MSDFIRGDCHKCKYETSAECVPRSQKIGFPHCYQSITTNYDRIRSMSVEEMASFFAQQEYRKPVFDGWLPLCNHVMGPRTCHENGCVDCWLDWLKQEASE